MTQPSAFARLFTCLAIGLTLSLATSSAYATDFTWTGGGGDALWTNVANWGAASYPGQVGGVDQDKAIFTTSATVTIQTGIDRVDMDVNEGIALVFNTGTSGLLLVRNLVVTNAGAAGPTIGGTADVVSSGVATIDVTENTLGLGDLRIGADCAVSGASVLTVDRLILGSGVTFGAGTTPVDVDDTVVNAGTTAITGSDFDATGASPTISVAGGTLSIASLGVPAGETVNVSGGNTLTIPLLTLATGTTFGTGTTTVNVDDLVVSGGTPDISGSGFTSTGASPTISCAAGALNITTLNVTTSTAVTSTNQLSVGTLNLGTGVTFDTGAQTVDVEDIVATGGTPIISGAGINVPNAGTPSITVNLGSLSITPGTLDLAGSVSLGVTGASTLTLKTLTLATGTTFGTGTTTCNVDDVVSSAGTPSITGSGFTSTGASPTISCAAAPLSIATLNITGTDSVVVTSTQQLTVTTLNITGGAALDTGGGAGNVVVDDIVVVAGTGTATITNTGITSNGAGSSLTASDSVTISSYTHNAGTSTFSTGTNTVTLTAIVIDEDGTIDTGTGNAIVVGAGGVTVTDGATPATISNTAGLTTSTSSTFGTAALDLLIAKVTLTGTPTVVLAGASVEFTALTIVEGATINATGVDLETAGVTVTVGATPATITGTLQPTGAPTIIDLGSVAAGGDLSVADLTLTANTRIIGENTCTFTIVDWQSAELQVGTTGTPTVDVQDLQLGINDGNTDITALTLTAGQLTIDNNGTAISVPSGNTQVNETMVVNGGTLLVTDPLLLFDNGSLFISGGTNHSISGNLTHDNGNNDSPPPTFLTLATGFAGELDVNGNLDFKGDNDDGTFLHQAGTLRLSGNWITGDEDVYTASGTATVVLDGATQTIDLENNTPPAAHEFRNLTIQGTGTKEFDAIVGAEFVVTGTLTIDAATFNLASGGVANLTAGAITINQGTLNHGVRTVDCNGLFTLGDSNAAADDAFITGSGNVNVGGGLTAAQDGAYNSTGLLTFDGDGNWSDANTNNFPATTIDGTAAVVTLTSPAISLGADTLTVGADDRLRLNGQAFTAGTLTVNGDIFNTTAADAPAGDAVLTVSSAVTINNGGEISLGGGTGVTTGTGQLSFTATGDTSITVNTGGILTTSAGPGGGGGTPAIVIANGSANLNLNDGTLNHGSANIRHGGDLYQWDGQAAGGGVTINGTSAIEFTRSTNGTVFLSPGFDTTVAQVSGGNIIVNTTTNTSPIEVSNNQDATLSTITIVSGILEADNDTITCSQLTVNTGGTMTTEDTDDDGGNFVLNCSGNLTVDAGGTFDQTHNTTGIVIEVGGDLTILGTFINDSDTTFSMDGGGATQQINAATSPGDLEITGGSAVELVTNSFTLSSNLIVGTGNNSLDLNGQTLTTPGLTMGGNLTVIDVAPGNGTLALTAAQIDIDQTLTVNGGTVDFQADFDNGNNDGTILQGGGVIKFGATGDATVDVNLATLTAFTGATAGSVQFDGTGADTKVTVDAAVTFFNLETTGDAARTVTVTTGGNGLNVDGSITINGQDLDITGTGTRDIEGTVLLTDGDFDAGDAPLDILGAVTITGGDSLVLGTGTNVITGSITNAGTLDMSSDTLQFAGAAWNNTGGALTNSSGADVLFNGALDTQTITLPGSTQFQNITVQHTAAGDAGDLVTVTGAAPTTDVLTAAQVTLTTGVLDIDIDSTFTATGGGNSALTITANGAFLSNTTTDLTHQFFADDDEVSISVTDGSFVVADPSGADAVSTKVLIDGQTTIDVNGTATFSLTGTDPGGTGANLDFERTTNATNFTFNADSTATLTFDMVDVVDANGAGTASPYFVTSPSTVDNDPVDDGNWVLGVVWNGAGAGGGDWSAGASWVGGAVPTGTESAVFNATSNGLNDPAGGVFVIPGSLIVQNTYTDNAAAITGTITVTDDVNFGGAAFNVTGTLIISGTGTSKFTGASVLTGGGTVRFNSPTTTTVNIQSAATTLAVALEIGDATNGTALTLGTANELDVTSLQVGNAAQAASLDTGANDATVDVHGGVTFLSTSTLTDTGGTTNVSLEGNWSSGAVAVPGTLTFDGLAAAMQTYSGTGTHAAVSIAGNGGTTTLTLGSAMNTGTLDVTASDVLAVSTFKLTTTTTALISGTLSTGLSPGELEVGTDLTVDGALNAGTTGTVDVNQDLAGSGAIAMSTGTLELARDADLTSLTGAGFTSTGLIDFNGTTARQDLTIDGDETITNVTITGSQDLRLQDAATDTFRVQGTLDITNGRTLDMDTNDVLLRVDGTLTLGSALPSAGILLVSNAVTTDLNGTVTSAGSGGTITQTGGTIEVAGAFNLANIAFVPTGGSTVDLNGTVAQAVTLAAGSDNWRNVDVTGAGTVSVSGGTEWTTISMDVQGGVLDLNTPTDFTTAETTIANGATLQNDNTNSIEHKFSGITGGDCLDITEGGSFLFTANGLTLTFAEGSDVEARDAGVGAPTTTFTITSAAGLTIIRDETDDGTTWDINIGAEAAFTVTAATVQDSVATGSGQAPLSAGGGSTVDAACVDWLIGSVWSGLGVAGDWADAGNWNGGVPGAGDTAVFNGDSNGGTPPSTNTVGLGTIDGLTITAAYTQTATLNATLDLNNNFTFDNTASTGKLALAGNVLNIGGNASITGSVGEGSGTLRFDKVGTATLTLTAAPTINANLQVGNGGATVLVPQNNQALDVLNLTISAAAAQLDLASNDPAVLVRGNLSVIAGGVFTEGDSDTTVYGNVSVLGTWTNVASADLVFADPPGGLGVPGAQTWTSTANVGEVVIDNTDTDLDEGTVVTLSGGAVAGTVTVTSNDELDGGTGNVLNISNFVMAGTYTEGTGDTQVDGTLNVTGTWTNNADTTAELRLDGTDQAWTAGTGLGEVLIEGAAGTVTLGAATNVLTLDIGAGKIFDANSLNVAIGSTTLVTPFTINATGTYTGNGGGLTTTITAEAASVIPIVDASYANLTVVTTAGDSVSLEVAASETIGGLLTVTGGTLATGAVDVTVAGVTGSGTLDASGGGDIITSNGFEPRGYTPGALLRFTGGTADWGRSGLVNQTASFGVVEVTGGTITADTGELDEIGVTTLTVSGGSLALGDVNFTPTGAVNLTTGAFTQTAAGLTTITIGQTFTTDGDTIGSLALAGAAGTHTLDGNLAIAGTLSLDAGEVLDIPIAPAVTSPVTIGGIVTVNGAGAILRIHNDATFGANVNITGGGLFRANEEACVLIFANASTVAVDGTSDIFIAPAAGQTTMRAPNAGDSWNMSIALGLVAGADVVFSDLAIRNSTLTWPGVVPPDYPPGGTTSNLGGNTGWDLGAFTAVWISTGTNPADDDWDVTANWQDGNLPIATSVVTMDVNATTSPDDNFSGLGFSTLGGLTMAATAGLTAEFDIAVTINGNVAIGAGHTVVSDGLGLTITGLCSGAGTLDADLRNATSVAITNGLTVNTYSHDTAATTLTLNGGNWSGTSNFGTVVLGGTVTPGSDLTVNSLDLGSNSFTLGANTLAAGGITDTGNAGTLVNSNAGGIVNTSGGIVVGDYTLGGTLRFSGAGAWTTGTPANSFGTVEVLAGGNVTQGSAILAGSIDVQAASLITGGSNLATAGNFTLSGGTLAATTSTVQVGGDWNSNVSVATFSAAGTLEFPNGAHAANFTGAADTLGILSLTGTANVTVTGASTINAERVVLAGTSVLDAGAGTTINVDENWSVPTGTTFTPSTSTVDFTGGNAHVLDVGGTATFYDVDFSGNTATLLVATHTVRGRNLDLTGGSLTLGTGGMVFTGNVNIVTGTLTGGGSMTVGGNWTNAATFNDNNTSTVIFNGTAHNVTSGGSNFYNMTLNLGATTDRVELLDNVTVERQVTLTQGILDVNTFTLTLTAVDASGTAPITAVANVGTLDGNGTGTVAYSVTSVAAAITVAPLTFNNLTLTHANAFATVFSSTGNLSLPATGTLTLTDATAVNTTTYQLGLNSALTTGLLAGDGTVNMGETAGTDVRTLEITGNSAVAFPAGIDLVGFTAADLDTDTILVRFSNATGATVGLHTRFPNVELTNGAFTWTTGSIIEGDLTLAGGATFAASPTLEFGGARTVLSVFESNNSDYTLAALRVNIASTAAERKKVNVDGNAGSNRIITDLQLLRGEVEVLQDLIIVAGTVGAAGDALGGGESDVGGYAPEAKLTHITTGVTLQIGDGTAPQTLTINDEFRIADGQPDVVLTLAADDNAPAGTTDFATLLINDRFAYFFVSGNQAGSGTSPNVVIQSTFSFTTGTLGLVGEPKITSNAAGGTPAGVNSIRVNRVDVKDNDCIGVTTGNRNEDDGSVDFTGATGLEATNSSQLNSYTNGWSFSGGGNITALLGEAISSASGRIADIRIAFDQTNDLNAATLGTVHDRFTMVLLDNTGTTTLESLTGTASSIEPNTKNLVVTFGDGFGKTSVENIEVRYVPPASSADFLRNTNSTPASFAFTIKTSASPFLVDGATPVVVSSFFQDLDLNGGLDRASFFLSEAAGFTSAAGQCASGFQPNTDTLSGGQNLTLTIAGETLATIALDGNGNLFTGAAVASRIQSEVRAVMDETPPGSTLVGGSAAHNPLNRPAFKNFTCVYLESEERYLLTAGVPIRFVGGAYVRDYTASTVTVGTSLTNDVATALKLDSGAGGRVITAGYGDGTPGVSVAGIDVSLGTVDFQNDSLTLAINGEPNIVLTAEGGLNDEAAMAQDVENKVRGTTKIPTSAGASSTTAAALANANTEAYSGFVVILDTVTAAGTKLLFVPGGEGSKSSVVVDPTCAFAIEAQMGSGATGATETVGTNNTVFSLEDLAMVSSNGQNLISGLTVSNITVSGTSIVVDLANQAGSGTANPSFLWRDNGNLGFVSDASGLPNRAADFANVAATDGVVIVGDTDGDRSVSVDPQANILVDVTNAIPSYGTTGFSVTYSWALSGTAPAGYTLNSSNTATLDFTATTAQTYTFLLTMVLLDASGNPVVNSFTDADGSRISTVKVVVNDIAPVADAGADQQVFATVATLDGSGSFDPNGGTGLTYKWTAVDVDGNSIGAAVFSADTSLTSTFTPGNVTGLGSGAYTLTLTATKTANSTTHSDTVLIIINDPANLLPVAEAGRNHVGRTNETITLSGAASADPEGTTLSYDWQVQTSPVSIALTNSTAVKPTFTPDLPGSYVFQLIVEDAGGLQSSADTVTVQVVDDLGVDTRRPPAAVAVVAALEHAVFLDTQPGGDITVTPPNFLLLGGTERRATIVDVAADTSDDPAAGTTTGLLAVKINVAGSLFATVYAPLVDGDLGIRSLGFSDASVGEVFRFGRVGNSFVLDGSQSQDDGAVSSFNWTQVDGPYKFSTQSGNLISVVPQTASTYEFQLIVTDNVSLDSLGQIVSVQVLPVLTSPAGPPTAKAVGGNGTTDNNGVATALPSTSVTLDASGSSSLSTGQFLFGAASDLTYSWTQLSGPTALFSGSTTAVTAQATLSVAGAYEFQVTVTDGNTISSKATVWVSVNSPLDDAPVAVLASVADSSLSATGTRTVTLDGNQSSGVTPLSYIWSQSAGAPFYVDPTGGQGSVTIDQPGVYTFSLQVVGGDGVTSPPAEVTFVILSTSQNALASGGSKSESSSGCALASGREVQSPGLGATLLLLLGLAFVGVRREGRS
jgi:fibronectin-binding autotransporter adhesin